MPDHNDNSRNRGTQVLLNGLVVPGRLGRLVNPVVWSERQLAIRARLEDETTARAIRRRYAEVITKHLLEMDGNV